MDGGRSKFADLIYPIGGLVMVGLVVGFIALGALFSGDHVNAATVRNATGREIHVLHASDREDGNEVPMHAKWSWPWQWRTPIAKGEGVSLIFDVFTPWIVEIDDGQCRYRYRVPWSEQWERENRGPLSQTDVQLEPDHFLYSVPLTGDEHTVDVSPYLTEQPPGFPVHPLEQNCNRQLEG